MFALREGIVVRQATVWDAGILSPQLRPTDIRELEAASGLPVAEELRRSVSTSKQAWVATDGEKILAMFGVSTFHDASPTHGVIWFVASTAIESHRKTLVRYSRHWLESLAHEYECVLNFVDARNQVSLRWLEWLGFRRTRLCRGFGTHGEAFWEIRYWAVKE